MSLVSMRDIITNNHPNYLQLLHKVWKKGLYYNKQYGLDDTRTEFFTNFSELLVWALIQFDDFIHTQDNSTGKIKKYLTLNKESTIIMVAQFDTINRASFLTKLMFEVEHLIKSILDYFNQNTGNGYGKLVDDFLNELSNTDIQTKKILKLPAGVRNALHNNGFTKYDIEETVLQNHTYAANKGDQITFAGWDNIFIIISALVDSLSNIIENSSRINSERHIPKKDHFIQ